MIHYEEHFSKIIDFLNLYQQLIDCHLVDFISHKLWDKCLPELLKLELENIETTNDIWKENENVSRLNEFIRMTKSLSLQSCPMILNYKDIPECLNLNLNLDNQELNIETNNKDVGFMSEKKCHEVETLGRVIGQIAKSTESLVIDAGAGKAYLSAYLSDNYKLPVLAIDSSDLCHRGAVHRTEKMKKVGKQSSTSVKYIVAKIDDNTDYNKMVHLNFPNWNLNNNLILTGLHTCGSLAHSIINVFLHNSHFKIICFVPCCYHLVNESFSKRITFSRNARMLAQQCIERTKKTKSLSPTLFYRALLQVLLHSMGIDNVKIGRGGPLNDFPTYANWALLKIGVDRKKIPSNEILEQLYQSHINLKLKLNLFQMLRIYISPVLEAAIILDRIVYLQNSMRCSKSFILRLFNPVLSPRQYAIVSIRN
ncbi:PREDICTED: methyltransferase-like protein 25 [Polistes dominula]|uniref:Methyltransferase-like protein 25 n=1 Tax=Polistes dominula TaxID=743375 RepID=A0ABM1IXR6_POLDO|nr:PREDICTED: methyltransferase-like protein 25 [Polistes dominula]